MKTSNKMLIGIAVAILVIPISTMVFSSLSGRVDYDVYMRGVAEEGVDLNAEDNFLSTTKLEKFNKVRFSGSEYTFIELNLIKADGYAVKVSQSTDPELIYEIDDEGTLNISSTHNNRYFSNIYILAPDLKDIEVSNAQVGGIHTDVDSLNLVVTKSNHFVRIGDNPNLKFLHLTVNESHLNLQSSKDDNSLPLNLQDLHFSLNNSALTLQSGNYNQVLVNATDSKFEITPPRGRTTTVGALQLTAFGESNVTFGDDIQIDSLSGVISDSTIVRMPYYMTKNLSNR